MKVAASNLREAHHLSHLRQMEEIVSLKMQVRRKRRQVRAAVEGRARQQFREADDPHPRHNRQSRADARHGLLRLAVNGWSRPGGHAAVNVIDNVPKLAAETMPWAGKRNDDLGGDATRIG